AAGRIYAKIASIPGLRPHDFIIANYPSLDDMYTAPEGLWGFGTWVNGGHWSTCEARMVMGYYRLQRFEDARRSMERLLTFARKFRMDNPLVGFGSAVYQPHEPINLCYDSFGPPAALVRGLFEYIYRADSLTLVPRIPPGITWIEQRFPVRFGSKRLCLAVAGAGPITRVLCNGAPLGSFDGVSVSLSYDALPAEAAITILRGDAEPRPFTPPPAPGEPALPPPEEIRALASEWLSVITPPADGKAVARREEPPAAEGDSLLERAERLRGFHARLAAAGLGDSYEAAHARLAMSCLSAACERRRLQKEGALEPLEPRSQHAADRSYLTAFARLCDGIERVIEGYRESEDPRRARIHRLWTDR
ncbi:MAG: hypothetical protein JXA90_14280, partial [Planctomycetes bacterium]|nr:hypothetical protein [Planctomycetota bacterium]